MNEINEHYVEPNSVLSEYVPLLSQDITISLNKNSYKYGFTDTIFEWCANRRDYPLTYEDGKKINFLSYKAKELLEENLPNIGADFADDLKWLQHQNMKLRQLDIMYCFRDQSIIVSKAIFKKLHFSEKVGVHRGEAILNDPFEMEHTGYHYISFLNPLPLDKAEKRFKRVPVEERPLIAVKYDEFMTVLLVHKKILKFWEKENYTGFIPLSDFDIIDTNGIQHCSKNDRLNFNGIANWQHNIVEH